MYMYVCAQKKSNYLRVILIFVTFTTGKTLLAKAVANQTSATFLRVCGSELIQKYLVSSCETVYIHTYAM